ncbi:unnamed protein product [Caenorhabditis bovis]|uniref:Uncharacterized protein n=1 Tax=Caenorhabditis bovis TaxID=2654633 RepID=A0A8S1F1V6_9PELO|nr:unnamed protein product [Caenorhabditis bovis]
MSTSNNENKKASKKAPEKRVALKKKTAKELEEMATAKANRLVSCESTEDGDPPPPPRAVPSESSMSKLNNQLKEVPIVKAFDKAEKKLEDEKSTGTNKK